MKNLMKIELEDIEKAYNQNAIDVLIELFEQYVLYYKYHGELIFIEDSEVLVDLYDDDDVSIFYVRIDDIVRKREI